MQQQRFCLVVPMMGQHQRLCTGLRHRFPEEPVPRFPGPVFAGVVRRIRPVGQQRHLMLFAQRPDEGFIPVGGVATQTVVHMDSSDLPACIHQEQQQRYAVCAAGEADQQPLRQILQLNHPGWARRIHCRDAVRCRGTALAP